MEECSKRSEGVRAERRRRVWYRTTTRCNVGRKEREMRDSSDKKDGKLEMEQLR